MGLFDLMMVGIGLVLVGGGARLLFGLILPDLPVRTGGRVLNVGLLLDFDVVRAVVRNELFSDLIVYPLSIIRQLWHFEFVHLDEFCNKLPDALLRYQ